MKLTVKPLGLTFMMLMALSAGMPSASAQEAAYIQADETDLHIEAIASSSADILSEQYDEHAHFEWVGGPLDGSYAGTEAIRDVWSKFAAGRGEMTAEVSSYTVSANPKGRTTVATILFQGNKTIPVRLVTTYRDDRITAEIWQIDPALMD